MGARTDTERLESPLSKAAVRALAAVVFGATLLHALSEPLASWNTPAAWPRAGVLPQGVFLLILAAGLAVQSLSIVLARRTPAGGLLVAFGVYAALVIALDAPGWLTAGSLAVAVAMFFVAVQGSVARTMTALVSTMVAFFAVHWFWAAWVLQAPADQYWPFLLRFFMNFAPFVLAGAALGAVWGRESRKAAVARREAEAARREHEERLARARELERARIAQELHDVAAQHLAGLLSLADAAADLAETDPETAVGLIADVRAEGRFAVASLYGALGELRSPGAAHITPTPDAQQIGDLVEQWRNRGMAVEVLTLGDLVALPAVVSVTAYRTVQEALANAAKHAPGAPVRVRLLADVGRLSVTVENLPSARAGTTPDDGIGLGWGLSGLRDRLTLLNGTLRAEATPDGGWRVSADLPLAQSETTGRAAQWAP